jgi:hypothetical protein
MRSTLHIEDDLLAADKQLARGTQQHHIHAPLTTGSGHGDNP